MVDVDQEHPFEVTRLRISSQSRHSARTVLTKRSAIAFAFGARIGVFTIRIRSLQKISSNGPEYLLSRSRIKNRICCSEKKRPRLRACWVTQQARNLGLDFSDQGVRFLVRDRDSKYSGPFDEVFRVEGIRIVKTPVRAPKANAIAERFVRTIRSECLDWLLILNRRHLEGVLRVHVDHYNRERPHRALDLQPPDPDEPPSRSTVSEIRRRDKLGGLLHEYYRAAA